MGVGWRWGDSVDGVGLRVGGDDSGGGGVGGVWGRVGWGRVLGFGVPSPLH